MIALLAHDPITTKITWTVEISRLVNRRCAACHGAGASVDLSSYETARPWAKAIRNQVLERKMPPWGAVKGFGDFQNDPSLTALELEQITQWVEGGAPEGDLALLPHATAPVERKAEALRWSRPQALVKKTLTVRAIRALGPTEASAYLPDGRVEHLLWVREKQPDTRQAYVLRAPVILPPGSKFVVTGAAVEIN